MSLINSKSLDLKKNLKVFGFEQLSFNLFSFILIPDIFEFVSTILTLSPHLLLSFCFSSFYWTDTVCFLKSPPPFAPGLGLEGIHFIFTL